MESLVPEVTITAEGVYWHPVGADNDDQIVTRDDSPSTRPSTSYENSSALTG
ncbi:hypothetical protein OG264_01620 [Streptomyces xanthophaeus]|uniref:hypothetical protein n=1 Tax=Streptomyces xanthophaeus TaxID=67385 RepID=UPI003870607E|nr:hypothetical protein OG264_01620 [Streptomyces xanthophaeus]WST64712.1 hypothetical protein OG605_36740 [Streptomyces xanthophaeus]